MTLLEAIQEWDEAEVIRHLESGELELTGNFRGAETELLIDWAEAQ